MLTVGEVAERLSAATGQPAPKLASALRNWLQQGWLVATKRHDRGTSGTIQAAVFDRYGLAAARILLAASSVGVHRQLGILKGTSVTIDPTSGHHIDSNPDLMRIVDSVRENDGVNWELRVIIRRSGEYTTCWLRNGEPDHLIAGEKLAEALLDTDEAVVRLPVSKLLAGLDLS